MCIPPSPASTINNPPFKLFDSCLKPSCITSCLIDYMDDISPLGKKPTVLQSTPGIFPLAREEKTGDTHISAPGQ